MNFLVKRLQIQPVVQLKHQRALLGQEIAWEVIVCVHQEKVRYWSIAPLDTGIDVHVVDLTVVLHKGSPEQIFGQGQVNSRAY